MRLTKSYFHLSNAPNLKKLTPRLPHEVDIRAGKGKIVLENTTIKRVCLSDNINGCIRGLEGGGIKFKDDKPVRMHCFQNTTSFLGLSNEEIIKRRYVFDAEITGEVWALEEIDVVLLYDVLVYVKVTDTIIYKPIVPAHLEKIPEEWLVDGNLQTFNRKYKIV